MACSNRRPEVETGLAPTPCTATTPDGPTAVVMGPSCEAGAEAGAVEANTPGICTQTISFRPSNEACLSAHAPSPNNNNNKLKPLLPTLEHTRIVGRSS